MASASVSVDKQLVSSIGRGILVLAAVARNDTQQEVEKMVIKILKMKLWSDENGANVCSTPPKTAYFLYAHALVVIGDMLCLPRLAKGVQLRSRSCDAMRNDADLINLY